MKVVMNDGREFNGIVYSSDPITDLAIVKVIDSTEMFPPVKLSATNNMRYFNFKNFSKKTKQKIITKN